MTIYKKDSLEVQKMLLQCASPHNPTMVLQNGMKELEKIKNSGTTSIDAKSSAFSLITLFEFDSPVLMDHGFVETYRSFLSNFFADLKKEYKCETESEKSLAYLVAQNFGRTMQIQRFINSQVDRESYTEMSTHRLAVLEKAYDRANRQYLSSLQMLKSLRQPPLNIVVKTDIANIANQQLIQENNAVKAK